MVSTDAVDPVTPAAGRPHPALAPFVDRYHGYDYEVADPAVHRGLPSSVATVVLALEQPLDVGWHGDPSSRARLDACASGLSTTAADIFQAGRQQGVHVGLTAQGARALLGIPLAALADVIVPLDDLLPPALRLLPERLAALDGWPARYRLLDRVLLAHLATVDAAEPRCELEWAFARIDAAGPPPRVAELATELGWSRRHLTSRFTAEYGIGPKELTRIARFQRSRDLVAAGHRLGWVAAECGFADQPHLTREWRALSGYTPRQWRAAEFPFLQDIVADGGPDSLHD